MLAVSSLISVGFKETTRIIKVDHEGKGVIHVRFLAHPKKIIKGEVLFNKEKLEKMAKLYGPNVIYDAGKAIKDKRGWEGYIAKYIFPSIRKVRIITNNISLQDGEDAAEPEVLEEEEVEEDEEEVEEGDKGDDEEAEEAEEVDEEVELPADAIGFSFKFKSGKHPKILILPFGLMQGDDETEAGEGEEDMGEEGGGDNWDEGGNEWDEDKMGGEDEDEGEPAQEDLQEIQKFQVENAGHKNLNVIMFVGKITDKKQYPPFLFTSQPNTLILHQEDWQLMAKSQAARDAAEAGSVQDIINRKMEGFKSLRKSAVISFVDKAIADPEAYLKKLEEEKKKSKAPAPPKK